MSQACSEAPTPGGPAGTGTPNLSAQQRRVVTRPWLHSWLVAGAGSQGLVVAQQPGGGGACPRPGSLPGA